MFPKCPHDLLLESLVLAAVCRPVVRVNEEPDLGKQLTDILEPYHRITDSESVSAVTQDRCGHLPETEAVKPSAILGLWIHRFLVLNTLGGEVMGKEGCLC